MVSQAQHWGGQASRSFRQECAVSGEQRSSAHWAGKRLDGASIPMRPAHSFCSSQEG